jgi:hypothetical protein
MKQKFKLVRLAIIIGIMVMQDFFKYSIMEIKDKTLFPMKNYGSCLERATAIFMKVIERALKFYALAIAGHREIHHGEGRLDEKVELAEDLTDREYKKASRGWWVL